MSVADFALQNQSAGTLQSALVANRYYLIVMAVTSVPSGGQTLQQLFDSVVQSQVGSNVDGEVNNFQPVSPAFIPLLGWADTLSNNIAWGAIFPFQESPNGAWSILLHTQDDNLTDTGAEHTVFWNTPSGLQISLNYSLDASNPGDLIVTCRLGSTPTPQPQPSSGPRLPLTTPMAQQIAGGAIASASATVVQQTGGGLITLTVSLSYTGTGVGYAYGEILFYDANRQNIFAFGPVQEQKGGLLFGTANGSNPQSMFVSQDVLNRTRWLAVLAQAADNNNLNPVIASLATSLAGALVDGGGDDGAGSAIIDLLA